MCKLLKSETENPVIHGGLNMLGIVSTDRAVSYALLIVLGQMAQCNATYRFLDFTGRVLLTLMCTL
jgi:hypothetical protein